MTAETATVNATAAQAATAITLAEVHATAREVLQALALEEAAAETTIAHAIDWSADRANASTTTEDATVRRTIAIAAMSVAVHPVATHVTNLAAATNAATTATTTAVHPGARTGAMVAMTVTAAGAVTATATAIAAATAVSGDAMTTSVATLRIAEATVDSVIAVIGANAMNSVATAGTTAADQIGHETSVVSGAATTETATATSIAAAVAAGGTDQNRNAVAPSRGVISVRGHMSCVPFAKRTLIPRFPKRSPNATCR